MGPVALCYSNGSQLSGVISHGQKVEDRHCEWGTHFRASF